MLEPGVVELTITVHLPSAPVEPAGPQVPPVIDPTPDSVAVMLTPAAAAQPEPEAVVVRFAGDSGDGMQLTGGQFTLSTALAGNDLATFPDFPAEIRAPQGTTFGVSAFQINFGSCAIETAGDQPDVLVAMNPAALKVNANQLRDGGLATACSTVAARVRARRAEPSPGSSPGRP